MCCVVFLTDLVRFSAVLVPMVALSIYPFPRLGTPTKQSSRSADGREWAFVTMCFFRAVTGGTGISGVVFARAVTGGTGANGLKGRVSHWCWTKISHWSEAIILPRPSTVPAFFSPK